MKPSPAAVPDKNYKDWFSGSDIFQNIRETIREVEIPMPHVSTGQEDIAMNTSFEDMFQLAPSCLAGSQILNVKAPNHFFIKSLNY